MHSFTNILSLTMIYSNNDPYLVVAIEHNHVILLHIPSDTIKKSLAWGSGEYLEDTISYLPYVQSRSFKDNKDNHDYITEQKIYLWTDTDDVFQEQG